MGFGLSISYGLGLSPSPSTGGTVPAIDGVIQSEAADYLQTESGDYLAFD